MRRRLSGQAIRACFKAGPWYLTVCCQSVLNTEMAGETSQKRQIALLDAPSNLGLRPPGPGAVPGCYKLPGALRDHGLLARLGAAEGGYVTPPRYDRGGWQEGDGVFNAGAIAFYSKRLADRIGGLLSDGHFPVVLGGDCSILLGSTLSLSRRGRHGLAFLDGHSDFRHPGNSDRIGAAAGEDLALVTGRGQTDLTDIEGYRPYVRDDDVAVVGIRNDDAAKSELDELRIATWDANRVRVDGSASVAEGVLAYLERDELDGFWVHVDFDILDPEVMGAVDTPSPGGIGYSDLSRLLADLTASERCVGLEVTIYDPDLDLSGEFAGPLADLLVTALDVSPSEAADSR